MGWAMMIGVAQVIGMKPTLRSFFSSAPPCANTSVAVLSGKSCESAASAVEAPTDLRKARRVGTLRTTALHKAGAQTPSERVSFLFILLAAPPQGMRGTSLECSESPPWQPPPESAPE